MEKRTRTLGGSALTTPFTKPEARYFLGMDNSGHRYAVPVEHREEWDKWSSLDEDDPEGWQPPPWAIGIEGNFTFTDPQPRPEAALCALNQP